MNKKQQSGFSVIEALIIIVVVAILGGVGLVAVLRNEAKSSDKKTGTTTQNQKTASTTTKTMAETGSKVYTNADLGFQVSYPKGWGDMVATGDGRIPPVTGMTDDITNKKDYPFYSGTMSFSIATRANYSITGQVKGVTYVPILKNSTYNNYIWKVVSVDPSDITNKVGDIYEAPNVASGAGVTMYDFQLSNGDTNTKRWSFETKAGFVTLSLPAFGPRDGKQPSAADVTAHQSITDDIRKSIQLIY